MKVISQTTTFTFTLTFYYF